jgi:hypothetical protein
MSLVTLLLGIHNHQPVGNFEQVFRQGFDQCYRPFVDVLERHPHIRLSLHYTGPLLDWFAKEEPGFLERLRSLIATGQVEMLGGGLYEPILSVIPDRDAVGQVNGLSQRIQDLLGVRPQGLWLAERVWDGGLPKKLAPTGLRYTILDDSHFFNAGFESESLSGYFLTEREGHPLAVFPISKDMRYLIPFRVPEELIDVLGRLRIRSEDTAVTYADDGEKFGMWPGTHQWVFVEGYLERLFTALEQNAEWIRLSTFSEYLQAHPATGRMYLPSASYEEMMEWALPTPASQALHERRAELEREGRLAAFQPFLRGGFWDGFLTKYSESNHMHKRMLDVSERIATMPAGGTVSEARDCLWRAQGNDVYWHGLFGGLYLNNLRHETYRNLIAAEIRIDNAGHSGDPRAGWVDVRVLDMDRDGHLEVLIATQGLGLCVAPACGGSLLELDYRPAQFNLLNVLARRPEPYHGKLAEASHEVDAGGGPPKSIHDLVKVKERGLDQKLIYDRHRRSSFVDRFLDLQTPSDALDRIDDVELGDFVGARYQSGKHHVKGGILTLPLKFAGTVRRNGQAIPISIEKTYRLSGRKESLTVLYKLESHGTEPCTLRFGMELNITLLAGNDPQRYYEWPGSNHIRLHERGEVAKADWFALVDEWQRFRVVIRLDRPGDIWFAPIETVSQSEEGFERTYQGSCILASRSLDLKPGVPVELEARLEISDL